MTRLKEQSDVTVDIQWIVAHVDDPNVRIVEVDVSPGTYEQGHIPGAVLWDAYADLRDSAYRPVPPPELRRLFSRRVFASVRSVCSACLRRAGETSKEALSPRVHLCA